MAFNDLEISNRSGRPVNLYEFRLGNTRWLYAAADQDITLGADTYLGLAVSDGGVTQGGSDQNDLQITVPANLPIAQLFRNSRPSGKVWLTKKKWHYGDAPTERAVRWVGSVTNSLLTDEATAVLQCRSIGGTYDRNGLRLVWGRTCPHPLYGVGCYADKSLHAYPRVIATLNIERFSCEAHSEAAEGTFSGGLIEWDMGDGSMQRRGIEMQDGNDFRVFGSTDGLVIGQEVTLYPGCARTTDNCKLFDNLPNYGGFPHMPGKSPFGGAQVF